MNTNTLKSSADDSFANVKRLPILISLIIGAFFSVLNETLLSIALPELEGELGVSIATLQWLSTGYMLVVAILIPASALLVQWFTTRQMFLGALFSFTLGTFICALAPGFPMLLAGRMIQAVGTGLMLPVLMNTIMVLYPVEKRGMAMGSIGLVIMFAPTIGPTLAGVILDTLTWRWLFYLVLPFACLSFLIAFIFLKNVTTVTKPKVDVLSIMLSTLAFGGIVYGISQVGEAVGGWSNPNVYVPSVIGIVSLALFVWRQLVVDSPILDLRPFKYPMFTFTVVLLIIMMMTMFSTLSILPFYMMGVLLVTTSVAGLILMPGALLNGLLSPIMGRLFDKFGPRVLVIPGTVLLVIILALFTQMSPSTSPMTLVFLYVMMNIALAMIMMPTQTNGLNQLPAMYYPHGIAILNTLQQVAGAIGVALFMTIMASGRDAYITNSSNPSDPMEMMLAVNEGVLRSFKFGFVFAIIALVLSIFIKRSIVPKAVPEE